MKHDAGTLLDSGCPTARSSDCGSSSGEGLNPNLAAALSLAAAGFSVFPCQQDRKPRSGVMWREQSTTATATIRAWWSRWPDSIPAIDLSKSGLIVADLDKHFDTQDGVAEFISLATTFGDPLENMPVVATPRGGFHLYYRQPVGQSLGNREGLLAGRGINIRGSGGYVIGPGAVLSGGNGWQQAAEAPDLITAYTSRSIPVLPEWLRDLIAPRGVPSEINDTPPADATDQPPSARERQYAKMALDDAARKVAAAQYGNRNNTLNRETFPVATLIPHYGLSREEAEAELTKAAMAVGLAREEVAATLKPLSIAE
jgi:hypothetical protein